MEKRRLQVKKQLGSGKEQGKCELCLGNSEPLQLAK
jgi:hypothetical protein